MTDSQTETMATYELPLPEDVATRQDTTGADRARSLSEPLLARNALWFCYPRCAVIVILALLGLLGKFTGMMKTAGLRPPGDWPFVAAGVLLAGNVLFFLHARRLVARPSARRAHTNLWVQITFDLLVLTAVVHFVGSTETFIAFAYLFHIVLACIFFRKAQSLAVTLLAIALFAACVAAEQAGIIHSEGILAGAGGGGVPPVTLTEAVVSLVSAGGIWLAVWFLASSLSATVRARDVELAATNQRLIAAQAERTRHMLVTTHQLKSPFAAIHANAQILRDGYCGPLPEMAQGVVRRIISRCERLAKEIQEMLQLANLSSTAQNPPESVQMDLAELLHEIIAQLEPIAHKRKITIDRTLMSVQIIGVRDRVHMLLVNLVANAVNYSHDGGRVGVQCRQGPGGAPVVTIADDGIGIPTKMLPRVFDEHFRTKEALAHNKESSGLGLAIVRQIAERYGIRLSVQSGVAHGTIFTLRFPHHTGEPVAREGETHGLSDDC